MCCNTCILGMCSVIASLIEVVCIRLLKLTTQHLSASVLNNLCALVFLSHNFAVALLCLFRQTRRPAASGHRQLAGWHKKAAIDVVLMLLGVAFHFLLDDTVSSLVLAVSMSFDAFVLAMLFYPFSDVGLSDAANGVFLEVAINLNKVCGGYLLPSSLLFSTLLILWRAYANSRRNAFS